MEAKLFELRDKGTCIPLLCIKPGVNADPFEAKVAWRYGYKDSYAVIVMHMATPERCKVDPYEWGDRTFHVAHLHIEVNWEKLKTGDLIDVRVLLGETDTPATPELQP